MDKSKLQIKLSPANANTFIVHYRGFSKRLFRLGDTRTGKEIYAWLAMTDILVVIDALLPGRNSTFASFYIFRVYPVIQVLNKGKSTISWYTEIDDDETEETGKN